MTKYNYDLFVIGGGSGGVRAARVAAEHGARVGICEESRLGGTCVIRGCVPKKLLVYASHFSEEFADAAGYGWAVDGTCFSWPDLVAAKEAEITRLEGVYQKLLEASRVKIFPVRGRLVDAHTVELGDERVTADRILIAVGGRPVRPDIPGAELGIVSDHTFDLPEFPDRILIIGGGYIAAEFAGIFNGLGAEVTVAYRRDRILRGFDHDVRRVVEAGMTGRGVEFRYRLSPVKVEKEKEGRLRVSFSDGTDGEYEQVMFATGRDPNTGDLGLESTGVETGPRGRVIVDAFSRSNVPNIFAVGDVTDRMALTPVALMEGHAFADSEFGGMERPVDHANVPSAVFCQPPVGVVGLDEDTARTSLDGIDVYRSEFTPMKNTLSGRTEQGLMKLVVERASGRVVGCHVVGPDAPEILQGFGVAVRAGLTKADFDRTIGIHPTSAEELVTLRQAVEGRDS